MWLQATRTQTPPTPLIFSALLLKNLAFPMTGCLGSFPFPKLCRSPITPHCWWEQLPSCFWQPFPVTAHWPRSAVYRGWQLGRSPGSFLCGNASHQLFWSNLAGICQSWPCGDPCHRHDPGLLGASGACGRDRVRGSRGPEVSGSSSVWTACWQPGGESQYGLILTNYICKDAICKQGHVLNFWVDKKFWRDAI